MTTVEDAQKAALQAFLRDSELEVLESGARSFNILSALGAVRRELRHSEFLAYLLNPAESHGLGAAFVRRVLHACVDQAPSPPVTSIDVSLADFSDLRVKREWANIDVLLEDPALMLVVVIENKIDADEGRDQLATYITRVAQRYPTHRRLLVYLTPAGVQSSHDDYVPIGYEAIAAAIRAVLASPSTAIRADVRMLVDHYLAVVEDQIVGKSEITELCGRIYKRHKTAIDLLFEHLPDRCSEASDFVVELIEAEPRLVLDKHMKNTVRFALVTWDADPSLKASAASQPWWSEAGRTLLFQFVIDEKKGVALKLSIGPGEAAFRGAMFDETKQDVRLFNGNKKKLLAQTQIFSKEIASADQLEGEYETAIRAGWEEFVRTDLAKLEQAVVDILRRLAASSPSPGTDGAGVPAA